MRNGISTLVLSGILAAGVATTGCDTYSYPTPIPDKNQMKENEYVYGKVDSLPKQSKNTYPTNPDAATLGLEVKKKLFADDPDVYAKWAAPGTPVVGNPSPVTNKATAPTIDSNTPTDGSAAPAGVTGNTDAYGQAPGTKKGDQ